MTCYPPSSAAYDQGINPWWDHVTDATPELRYDGDQSLYRDEDGNTWSARHHFAMFAGPKQEPGPMGKTFLQLFLEQSGFDSAPVASPAAPPAPPTEAVPGTLPIA